MIFSLFLDVLAFFLKLKPFVKFKKFLGINDQIIFRNGLIKIIIPIKSVKKPGIINRTPDNLLHIQSTG